MKGTKATDLRKAAEKAVAGQVKVIRRTTSSYDPADASSSTLVVYGVKRTSHTPLELEVSTVKAPGALPETAIVPTALLDFESQAAINHIFDGCTTNKQRMEFSLIGQSVITIKRKHHALDGFQAVLDFLYAVIIRNATPELNTSGPSTDASEDDLAEEFDQGRDAESEMQAGLATLTKQLDDEPAYEPNALEVVLAALSTFQAQILWRLFDSGTIPVAAEKTKKRKRVYGELQGPPVLTTKQQYEKGFREVTVAGHAVRQRLSDGFINKLNIQQAALHPAGKRNTYISQDKAHVLVVELGLSIDDAGLPDLREFVPADNTVPPPLSIQPKDLYETLATWYKTKSGNVVHSRQTQHVLLARDLQFVGYASSNFLKAAHERVFGEASPDATVRRSDMWMCIRLGENAVNGAQANLEAWATRCKSQDICRSFHKEFFYRGHLAYSASPRQMMMPFRLVDSNKLILTISDDDSEELNYNPEPSSKYNSESDSDYIPNSDSESDPESDPEANTPERYRQVAMTKSLYVSHARRLHTRYLESNIRGRSFKLEARSTIVRPVGSTINFTFGEVTCKKVAPEDPDDFCWQLLIPLKRFNDMNKDHKAWPHKKKSARKRGTGKWSQAKTRRHDVLEKLDSPLWLADHSREDPRLWDLDPRGHIRVTRNPATAGWSPTSGMVRTAAVDPGGRPPFMVFDNDSGDNYAIGINLEAAVRFRLSRIAKLQAEADGLINADDDVIAVNKTLKASRASLYRNQYRILVGVAESRLSESRLAILELHSRVLQANVDAQNQAHEAARAAVRSSAKVRKLYAKIAQLHRSIKNKVRDMQLVAAKFLACFDINFHPVFDHNQLSKRRVKGPQSLTKQAFKMLCHAEHIKRLRRYLRELGWDLLVTNEAFSTKACSRCGHLHDVGRKKIYICRNCKTVMHRDGNASAVVGQLGPLRTLTWAQATMPTPATGFPGDLSSRSQQP
ncbi:hypothetical protein HDU87_001587 [Geranomyces variabilis]|uniref:Cas12f1-like TNB domain-containing protein n=1 Tax=Geranomyces variabilis TaxID=109894 RepID=A0AAD5XTT6_9FUNG|nr:hypothetical protein HDU87_001587 [Geranomyces variabilis]